MIYPTREDFVVGDNDPLLPNTWNATGRRIWQAVTVEHDTAGTHPNDDANLVYIMTGRYTGNGTNPRVISLGSPLTISYLEVYPNFPYQASIKSKDMVANASFKLGASSFSTADITGFGVGEFTVTGATNSNNSVFYYIAFGTLNVSDNIDIASEIDWIAHGEKFNISDPPNPDTDPPLRPCKQILDAFTVEHLESGQHKTPPFAVNARLITGTYTGNGSSRTLSIPDVGTIYRLMIWRDGGFAQVYKDLAMPDTEAKLTKIGETTLQTGYLSNLTSNSVDLSTANEVNANGVTYYYAAWGKNDLPTLQLVVKISNNDVMNYRYLNSSPSLTEIATIFGGNPSDYTLVSVPSNEIEDAMNADFITYNGSVFSYVMKSVTLSTNNVSIDSTWDKTSTKTISAFSQSFSAIASIIGDQSVSSGYYVTVCLYRNQLTGEVSYYAHRWNPIEAVTGLPVTLNVARSGYDFLETTWTGILRYTGSAWGVAATTQDGAKDHDYWYKKVEKMVIEVYATHRLSGFLLFPEQTKIVDYTFGRFDDSNHGLVDGVDLRLNSYIQMKLYQHNTTKVISREIWQTGATESRPIYLTGNTTNKTLEVVVLDSDIRFIVGVGEGFQINPAVPTTLTPLT